MSTAIGIAVLICGLILAGLGMFIIGFFIVEFVKAVYFKNKGG